MNKLDELRIMLSLKEEELLEQSFPETKKRDEVLIKIRINGLEAGWDAAMALSLPVKFAEWKAMNGIKSDIIIKGKLRWMKYEGPNHKDMGNTQELFDYWLENIYKPE